jgi:hypothetical protein
MFIYNSNQLGHGLRIVFNPMEYLMRLALPFAAAVLPALILAAPASAQSSIPGSARASGEIIGASVEVSARLVASGVTVTAGTVVGITGTGAALVTGDPEVLEESWNLAGKIAEAPFADLQPLPIDDDVIIAAPAPNVPFDGQTAEEG